MISIENKCQTYEKEVQDALNLLKRRKIIIILPTCLLVALGVALAIIFVSKIWIGITICFIGLLWLLLGNKILQSRFEKLNDTIVKKFNEYYSPYDHVYATMVADNKQFTNIVRLGNPLICWKDKDALNYIGTSIYQLPKLKIEKCQIEEYSSLLSGDFGKLVVPISDVDHYREKTLVCKMPNTVLKITFADAVALDKFIPQKDFYFITEKKEMNEI